MKDFRQNYITGTVQIVDVYNMMCAVTGVRPHRNQGSWKMARDLLNQLPNDPSFLIHSTSSRRQNKTFILSSIIFILYILYLKKFS